MKTQSREFAINLIKKYSVIILGCAIYSLGVALFLDANNLAAGGVTGIAIVINYLAERGGLIGWDTGVIIVILNVPLFILGAVFFGRKFIASTLFSTVVSSALIELWTYALAKYLPVTDKVLISAIVGGTLYGAGLGLIFKMGSTTGGTDIIVKILRKKFRHLRMGVISMIIDVIIVGVSAFIYKNFELTFYTVLSLVLFTFVFDWVLYGGNSAKLVFIITTAEHSQKICDGILKELDVSATVLDGKGAYTDADRVIVMCAVKNLLYPKLRDIIKQADPRAFTIVSSAKEIYGEGYKAHGDDE